MCVLLARNAYQIEKKKMYGRNTLQLVFEIKNTHVSQEAGVFNGNFFLLLFVLNTIRCGF